MRPNPRFAAVPISKCLKPALLIAVFLPAALASVLGIILATELDSAALCVVLLYATQSDTVHAVHRP